MPSVVRLIGLSVAACCDARNLCTYVLHVAFGLIWDSLLEYFRIYGVVYLPGAPWASLQVPSVGLGVKQNVAFLGPAVRHIVRCVVFDLLLVAGWW